MPPGVLVFLGVVAVLGVAFVLSYNRFVEQRNLIRDSWANVETELQRRYDLIPNLVETVKAYATHESSLFEHVAKARAAAAAPHDSPKSKAADENVLVGQLRTLFAVSEDYPDLQASDNFLGLQRELTNTEDRIQASRRFYNANVRDFNRRVESVPSNLIASMFNFVQQEYFQIDAVARDLPSVDF